MSYWHVYSNVNNYFIHHHLFLFFHDSREAESILEVSSEESQYRCIHNITDKTKMSLTSLPNDIKFEIMTHLDSLETLGSFLDAIPSTKPLLTSHFYTLTKQLLKSTWKHPTTHRYLYAIVAAHISGPFDTVEDLNSFLDDYWPHDTPLPQDPITTTHNSHAFSLPSTFPNTREALDYMCTVQQAVEYSKKIFPYPNSYMYRDEWIDWGILRVQLYTELFHVSSFLHDPWREVWPGSRAFWDRFTKDEEMESERFVRLLCYRLIDRRLYRKNQGREWVCCRGFVCFLMMERGKRDTLAHWIQLAFIFLSDP